MSADQDLRVQAYWQAFLHKLPSEAKIPGKYEAWGFGDSPEMADKLGALVKRGIKTATASLMWAYQTEDEPLPEAGDYSIILDGKGEPLCIIRTTRVYIRPFNEVDEEQAYLEGEGDRSLNYWREVHWRFFSRECDQIGRTPDETMPVICERFELVYHEPSKQRNG
jgi:uncharacterized protein YhfF